MEHKLAILVLSCDKYADLWQPFMQQFRIFFPSDNYKIYLGSNKLQFNMPGIESVLSGDDLDWSTSLKRILFQIDEPKVFVILEDLFLASPIDLYSFHSALSFLYEKNAMHIKYWAIPMRLEPTDNPRIGIYPKGAPYRVTACGFWDREYLISLLIEGESPWNFEIQGSYRSSYSEGFYGLTRPLCKYYNMIEKGCWIPQSVNWALSEGLYLELDKRSLHLGSNQISSRFKMFYFDLIRRIPWRWRVSLMNKLRRALISY